MKDNWIPKWLGINFAILYSKFKNKKFNFQQAKKELNIEETTLLKILSELSRKGFAIATKGVYQLINFDALCNGIRAEKEFRDLTRGEILKNIYKKYKKEYLITGSYAAYLYHNYQTPVYYEIEVLPRDYGFWKNFDFKIKPILTKKGFKQKKIVNKLFVKAPENIIVESLKQATISSILDAICILVAERSRKYLNWQNLEKLARKNNLTNELGVILDILEQRVKKTYNKSLINKKYLNELFTHIKIKGREKLFPKHILKKELTYPEASKKWRILLYIPKYLFEKAVDDIAPFTLKVV